MPLYELVLVCRMGENSALSALIKAVSTTVLSEGGVVRGYRNLGDRVMPKNFRASDGVSHGVGRFIQVEYYGSPSTRSLAEKEARQNNEVLRLFTNKAENEGEYMKRLMLQLNAEVSPFKDEETKDSGFLREVLDKYRQGQNFKEVTSNRKIYKNDKKVHYMLKQMETSEGAKQDAQTLKDLHDGVIDQTDAKLKAYLLKKFQGSANY